MGKSRREWYEVRVREDGVKKSKFYLETGPDAAARHYRGSGHLLWVEKTSKEKFLGVGSFFNLGDQLLREFAKGPSLAETTEVKTTERVRERRAFSKSRKAVID